MKYRLNQGRATYGQRLGAILVQLARPLAREKNNRAHHTDTKIGFTGSRSLIQIQSGLVSSTNACKLHVRVLHCWTGSHALSQSAFTWAAQHTA